MGRMRSFKEEYTFEERSEESRDIIAKYPDRVPVVVEKYSRTELPEMEKKKYLVPPDMSVGQFIHILSSRLHLTPGKALFVFVKIHYLKQAVSWVLFINLSRMKMGFYTCVTVVRKPLVKSTA